MNIVYPLHNIRLLDFNAIYKKYAEPKLIEDIDKFNLIKDDQLNMKNGDVKRLFYHHIIFELCEYILTIRSKEKVIIVYCNTIPPRTDLLKYVHFSDQLDFFNTLVKRITNILPLKILITNLTFNIIRRNKNSGETHDAISAAKAIADRYDIANFTYSKARYFAKANGLEYLSNNYFKKIKSKQLIYQ